MQEDGKVITVEALERRTQAQTERAAKLVAKGAGDTSKLAEATEMHTASMNGINPARQQQIQMLSEVPAKRLSKNQQKKLALLEERPPPPKPIIPEGIKLPDGEEDWLSLWDLSDDELERRVVREKKRKAAERKALREKQKEGKAERRAARDERRKVYREKKLEWKAIKGLLICSSIILSVLILTEEEKVQKRNLLRVEQEEAKRIAIEVNLVERARAMEVCADLGFTLENVEGVDDIKPKALGMRGQEVDFDLLEIGDRPSELKIRDEKYAAQLKSKPQGNRIDLSKAPDESKTKLVISNGEAVTGSPDNDFISFDFGGEKIEGGEFEELKYNHKLRRKLHRAIEAAQIKKELLVRAKAKDHCKANAIEIPPELAVEYTPVKLTGRRTLEDGTIETEKQERIRKRLELAEYNKAAKVLRAQAKAEAIEAGLRVFAELTGKINREGDTQTGGEKGYLQSNSDEVSAYQQADGGLETKVSKKRHRSCEDSEGNPEKKIKKSKMAASFGDSDAIDEVSTLKKSKKSEKESIDENEEGDKARKERKRLRKERSAQTSEEVSNEIIAKVNKEHVHQGKKSKNKHKKATEDESPGGTEKSTKKYKKEPRIEEEDSQVKGTDQWNTSALSGDAARKDKFRRLLGAGKVNSADKTNKSFKGERSSSKSMVDISAIEDDLERQFEAGVRMKHDGQGKRRGLGA